MAWPRADDASDSRSSFTASGDVEDSINPNRGYGTRRVVKSQCRTEEVEPGKFIRKCEKTEQILKDFLGRPAEVVRSNTEYTEDDVTDEMGKGRFALRTPDSGPFDFPGLRSDIEAIEGSLFGGMGRLFDMAEEMRNGFFGIFGDPHVNDGSSRRWEIPIEDHYSQSNPRSGNTNDGESGLDLSGLAHDI